MKITMTIMRKSVRKSGFEAASMKRMREDGPEEVPQRAERDRKADVGSTSSRQKPRVVKSNPSTQKISQMRPRKGSGMEVCVIKPRSMEDTHEITETLQENCTVVLNMEGIDMDLAQRIIDFSSGSCYALHGGHFEDQQLYLYHYSKGSGYFRRFSGSVDRCDRSTGL